eukprot:Gb_40332 [translate_table: standard]
MEMAARATYPQPATHMGILSFINISFLRCSSYGIAAAASTECPLVMLLATGISLSVFFFFH